VSFDRATRLALARMKQAIQRSNAPALATFAMTLDRLTADETSALAFADQLDLAGGSSRRSTPQRSGDRGHRSPATRSRALARVVTPCSRPAARRSGAVTDYIVPDRLSDTPGSALRV
jgi:hypothetical protein